MLVRRCVGSSGKEKGCGHKTFFLAPKVYVRQLDITYLIPSHLLLPISPQVIYDSHHIKDNKDYTPFRRSEKQILARLRYAKPITIQGESLRFDTRY